MIVNKLNLWHEVRDVLKQATKILSKKSYLKPTTMKRLNKNQHENFTFVKIFVAIMLGLLLTQMVKSNLQEDAFSRLQNVEEVSEGIPNTKSNKTTHIFSLTNIIKSFI